MHKISSFIFILCSFLMSHAQIAAGSRYVNGRLGFSMQNIVDNSTQKQYGLNSNISAKYAFFQKENVAKYFAVGYGISHNYTKQTNPDSTWQRYTNNNQSISLVYGKQRWISLKNIHPSLYVTLEGGVVTNVDLGKAIGSNQDSIFSTTYSRGAEIGFHLAPTIALFLSKKWLLQTSLGNFSTSYNLTQSEQNGRYVYLHGFNFSPSFSPSNWRIGISYFWNKKE